MSCSLQVKYYLPPIYISKGSVGDLISRRNVWTHLRSPRLVCSLHFRSNHFVDLYCIYCWFTFVLMEHLPLDNKLTTIVQFVNNNLQSIYNQSIINVNTYNFQILSVIQREIILTRYYWLLCTDNSYLSLHITWPHFSWCFWFEKS